MQRRVWVDGREAAVIWTPTWRSLGRQHRQVFGFAWKLKCSRGEKMENRTRINSYKQDAQPRRLSAVGRVTPTAAPSCCRTSHTARSEAPFSLRVSAAMVVDVAQQPPRGRTIQQSHDDYPTNLSLRFLGVLLPSHQTRV